MPRSHVCKPPKRMAFVRHSEPSEQPRRQCRGRDMLAAKLELQPFARAIVIFARSIAARVFITCRAVCRRSLFSRANGCKLGICTIEPRDVMRRRPTGGSERIGPPGKKFFLRRHERQPLRVGCANRANSVLFQDITSFPVRVPT